MTNINQKNIYELLNIDVRDCLIEFLDISIPYQGHKGWENHIINALSSFQKSREYLQPTLQSLDLAELLSVMQYNWRLLTTKYGFSLKDKGTLSHMRSLRNDSAHFKGISEEDLQYELTVIIDFLKMIQAKDSIIGKVEDLFRNTKSHKEQQSFLYTNTGSYQGNSFSITEDEAKQLLLYGKGSDIDERIKLALCYEFGVGTTINLNEAFKLFSSISTGKGLYHAGRFLLSHQDFIPNSSKTAFQFFRKSALEGYTEAFSAVSYCYHQGIGIETDYSEMLRFAEMGEENIDPASLRYIGIWAKLNNNEDLAFQYYAKSYELGDSMSGYNLAIIYLERVDIMKAKEIIQKVIPSLEQYARQGDCIASFVLGDIYLRPYFVLDTSKSFRFFLKSATLNYVPAFSIVGLCYWEGNGTAVDKHQAIKWYKKGANDNNIDCCQILGKILLEGCKEAEVEPDYIEAEQCFDRIIDNDPESAYLNKGILHLKMHFCDYPGYHAEQAFSFFQKGFEAGSPLCSYYLGLCYLFEIGTEIDNKKAKELFNKAYSDNPFNANIAYPIVIIQADMERSDILLHGLAGYSNDVLAKYILGEKLLKSTLDTDEEKGLALMQEAAEQGLSIAENYLGEYFEKSDQEKSLRFYEEAANNGFASSSFNLGRVFEEGKIVKKDKVKAKEYYTSASQNSCKAADYKLKGIKNEEEITEEFERYKSKLRNITILGGLFFQYFSDTNFMKFMDEEAIEKESTNIASLCSSLSLD